jgi:hypothetical protein
MKGSSYYCPVNLQRTLVATDDARRFEIAWGSGCRDKTTPSSKRTSICESRGRRDPEGMSHALLTEARSRSCLSSASGPWYWEPRRLSWARFGTSLSGTIAKVPDCAEIATDSYSARQYTCFSMPEWKA